MEFNIKTRLAHAWNALVNQQKPKTCTTTFIERGDILCLVLNIYVR